MSLFGRDAVICLGLVAVALGCLPMQQVVLQQPVSTFDASFIRTVAVLEFENGTNVSGAGKAVAEHLEEVLANESPYDVMARIDLDRVAEERNLRLSVTPAREDLVKLGEAVGVTAVVIGTVDECGVTEAALSAQEVRRTARVSMRVKVVDTLTGRIAWSRQVAGACTWSGWTDDARAVSCRACLRAAMTRAAVVAREWFPRSGTRVRAAR